jgi:hypothetical protein
MAQLFTDGIIRDWRLFPNNLDKPRNRSDASAQAECERNRRSAPAKRPRMIGAVRIIRRQFTHYVSETVATAATIC